MGAGEEIFQLKCGSAESMARGSRRFSHLRSYGPKDGPQEAMEKRTDPARTAESSYPDDFISDGVWLVLLGCVKGSGVTPRNLPREPSLVSGRIRRESPSVMA